MPKKRPIRHEASWAAAKSLLLRKADRLPLYALQSTENGRFVDVDPPPDKEETRRESPRVAESDPPPDNGTHFCLSPHLCPSPHVALTYRLSFPAASPSPASPASLTRPRPSQFALFAHADSTSLSLSSVFALPSSGRGSLLHLAALSRSPETTPRSLEIVRD